jgi:hypothetical protein
LNRPGDARERAQREDVDALDGAERAGRPGEGKAAEAGRRTGQRERVVVEHGGLSRGAGRVGDERLFGQGDD